MLLPEVDIVPLRGGPVLRWGVLAPGGIAGAWTRGVLKHTDQVVAAVGSRSLDRAQEYATRNGIPMAYGSYEQLVADPTLDVIYIASPHNEHLRLALLAIAAGKHVLVEKPIATTAADARTIATAAKAAGVFAQEALWTRFHPRTSVIAHLLADGALGEVTFVTADFSVKAEYDLTSRMFNPELAGGALLDLGVYTASFAHLVLGVPSVVTARGSLAVTGVDAQSTVVLDYPATGAGHGRQAVMTTDLFAAGNQRAVIVGTDAILETDGPFWSPGGFTFTRGDEVTRFVDKSGVNEGDGLAYQVVSAAQNISDGLLESPLRTLQDSIEVLEILDAARGQLGAK